MKNNPTPLTKELDIHFPENLKLDWSKHTIGERTKQEIIEYIDQAIKQERSRIVGKVVKWMRIENEVSIVHKEEWESFIKALENNER